MRAVRTRLELLAIELKEEKAWLMRSLVVAVAALYLLTFGLLLAIFALVLWAVGGEPARDPRGFARWRSSCGGVGGRSVHRGAPRRSASPLFEDTIAVLKGDESGLQRGAAGHR